MTYGLVSVAQKGFSQNVLPEYSAKGIGVGSQLPGGGSRWRAGAHSAVGIGLATAWGTDRRQGERAVNGCGYGSEVGDS